MSARDDMHRDWQAAFDTNTPLVEYLLAAGYRKPRTITDPEELDTLPVGSVVLDPDTWLFRKQDERRYVVAGSSGSYSPDTVDLPATVLYTPEES